MATFLKTKNTVGRVTAKLMSPDCDVNCNEELYECVEALGSAIVWPDDLDSPITPTNHQPKFAGWAGGEPG